MKKDENISRVLSERYNKFVSEYEIAETQDEDGSLDYTFNHKETGNLSISLNYSPLNSFIEIRLLEIKGIFLIRTNQVQSMIDFIDLPIEKINESIHFIDIQGEPPFYYSAKLSDNDQTFMDIAADEHLQVKLITAIAEVKLALHFSGLLYQKHSTED